MQDIQNGCYDICTNCFTDGNCCSSFDRINAPVLNKQELIQLREALKKDDFYDIVSDNLYKIRLNNNECIFLKNGKCEVYNYRPLDCKLYPFDIIKKDSKYYLVLYQLKCIEEYTDDRNYTKMKRLKYKVIKEIKE